MCEISIQTLGRQPQAHTHSIFNVGNFKRTAMQLHDLLDKVQPQAGAFAATEGPWQRIEALAQAPQRVVGNRLALVEQA
ncbi:hypothetical protein D3C77_743590 [compost metagenome]